MKAARSPAAPPRALTIDLALYWLQRSPINILRARRIEPRSRIRSCTGRGVGKHSARSQIRFMTPKRTRPCHPGTCAESALKESSFSACLEVSSRSPYVDCAVALFEDWRTQSEREQRCEGDKEGRKVHGLAG